MISGCNSRNSAVVLLSYSAVAGNSGRITSRALNSAVTTNVHVHNYAAGDPKKVVDMQSVDDSHLVMVQMCSEGGTITQILLLVGHSYQSSFKP